jgi:phage shock protein PspC (stress-responsive transcriptional regulator)
MSIVMNLMAVPSYVRLISGVMGEGDWLLLIFALWQLGILIFYVILWKLIESFSNKKESE